MYINSRSVLSLSSRCVSSQAVEGLTRAELSSKDVIICRRKGARDGDFELFTLLELVLRVSS